MKSLASAAFLFALVQCSHGLDRSLIVGAWHATSSSEVEDGVTGHSNEIVIYREDGTFYSEGSGIIVLTDTNTRLLTIAGPESGTWSVKGGKLHVTPTDSKIDFFSSSMDLSREAMEEAIEETLKEPEIYEFLSKKENSIILKDSEGDETTMKPLSELPEEGRPLAKALATFTVEELGGDPTVRPGVDKDLVGERMRRTTQLVLRSDGFTPSAHLPTLRKRAGVKGKLRPKEEILSRLLCNFIAVTWASAAEEDAPSKSLLALVEHHHLAAKMTPKEKKILALERDAAKTQFGDSVGWKMENMWALAWVLGFDSVPDVDQGQITAETIGELWAFIATLAKAKDGKLDDIKPRSLREVAQLEDLFYCAHNAVRSAQLGNPKTVPKGFHPLIDGGAVHEKRHSLTWTLSPEISWEKTDLST